MTLEAQRIHDAAMAQAPKPDVRVRTSETTSRELTDVEKAKFNAGIQASPSPESED